MKALDLNFASNPFRNHTPYYLGYGLGTLALAAFTAYNAYAFMSYSKNQAELESDYSRKKTRLEALYEQSGRLQGEITKRDIAALNDRAKFTNELLDRRRFSWTALLNSLEEVQPYQVRLMSLRPIIQPKGILIDARAVAKDLQAFWNFQQNLQNHVKFRRVYPAGYLRSDTAGEFIFNISFNYFPDGAPADFVGLTPEEAKIVQAPGSGRAGAAEEELEEEAEAAAPAPPPPAKSAGPKPGLRQPPSQAVLPAPAVHNLAPPAPAPIAQHPINPDPRGARPGPANAREPSQRQPYSVRQNPANPGTFTLGGIPDQPPGQAPPSASLPPSTKDFDRSKMRGPRTPLSSQPPPQLPPQDRGPRRLPLEPPPKPDEGDATSGDATSEDENP